MISLKLFKDNLAHYKQNREQNKPDDHLSTVTLVSVDSKLNRMLMSVYYIHTVGAFQEIA